MAFHHLAKVSIKMQTEQRFVSQYHHFHIDFNEQYNFIGRDVKNDRKDEKSTWRDLIAIQL